MGSFQKHYEAPQKLIVEAVSSLLHEEVGPDGNVYEVWQCPKGNMCQKAHLPLEKRMFRKKKGGYTNLFKHLCLCYESEKTLREMYANSKLAEDNAPAAVVHGEVGCSDIKDFFKSASAMSSPKAKAYYGWLSWIVKKNMPLSSVEDEDHRLFSVHKIEISTWSLVKLMNKIVEKVEI